MTYDTFLSLPFGGIVGSGAAIANAVPDAIDGASIDSLPIRPHEVLALLTAASPHRNLRRSLPDSS